MLNSNVKQSKWQTSPVPCLLLAACAVVAYGSVLASTAKKHELLSATRGHVVVSDTSLASMTAPTLIAKSGAVSPALIAAR